MFTNVPYNLLSWSVVTLNIDNKLVWILLGQTGNFSTCDHILYVWYVLSVNNDRWTHWTLVLTNVLYSLMRWPVFTLKVYNNLELFWILLGQTGNFSTCVHILYVWYVLSVNNDRWTHWTLVLTNVLYSLMRWSVVTLWSHLKYNNNLELFWILLGQTGNGHTTCLHCLNWWLKWELFELCSLLTILW